MFLNFLSVGAQLNYNRQHPLAIGLDVNYAPLQSVGDDGLPKGYDIDFTRELMKRLNVPFVYVPNTWEHVASDVMDGKTDLAMMVYSSYRKDTINYSRPIFRLYYQIVYRKKDYQSFDFRNLKGKTFAYLQSRPIGNMMTREGAKGVHVVDLEKAIIELDNGKYDALICYRYQASYLISHFHLSGLQTEELSLQPREYCYVSHNKALIDVINRELAKMEAEGIIDKIYGKKVISDFDSAFIPSWVWYLFGAIVFAILVLFLFLLYRSRKRLQETNAMLETSSKILEMSNSELLDANKQLIKANERAEESSKMKSNFIKQISHEIRTPLNILSGFTQIITTPGLELEDEEKADINRQILENTNRITGLVNKMLELSDVRSRVDIECTDIVSPVQIANEAIDVSGIENVVHLYFNRSFPKEADDMTIKTNLSAAVRILSLILDNACKFTAPAEALRKDDNPVAKQKAVLRLDLDTDKVLFIVENTGITIPTSEAERIFDEFVQLNEYYDGTGIGLTVARSLARRLGGDVILDTSFVGGARFVVTLPIVN